MTESEQATVAGGCFWCVEAAFERVRGVESVVSGYCGGHTDDPGYREVCNGTTGHAEAVQVTYDPDEISYREILEVFFEIHDPTTENREGPDVGSQYRSGVYYHDETQREAVESYIDELESEGVYDDIVTEVAPLETFYVAEEKHQSYFEKQRANGENTNAYCSIHAQPKVDKVKKMFETQEPKQ